MWVSCVQHSGSSHPFLRIARHSTPTSTDDDLSFDDHVLMCFCFGAGAAVLGA
jgi:hypothetical protein